MDDVKEKAKDLIKKLRNPFVVTPKFKGQGHKLGGSSDSSGNGTDNKSSGGGGGSSWRKPELEQRQQQQQGDWRKLQQEKWERERASSLSSNGGGAHRRAVSEEMPPLSSSSTSSSTGAQRPSPSQTLMVARAASTPTTAAAAPAAAFDPCTAVIGSQKSSSTLNLTQEKNVQCPVCQKWWKSETEVSAHLEECLAISSSVVMDGSDGGRGDHNSSSGGKADRSSDGGRRDNSSDGGEGSSVGGRGEGSSDRGRGEGSDDGSGKSMQDLGEAVSMLLLGGPSNATLGVFVRLLSNILGDSKAEKYRRVRLANPKIRETVGMALGGVEFLESVGFRLIADGEEVVAVMDDPSETQMERIKQALVLLEPYYVSGSLPSTTASQPSNPANRLELRKVDRQMRLFHPSDENQAAKIELPDSFFELTASEVKMEAAARKKRPEEGQLLIPKSYRAKQASMAQRRYKAALIRVQFPDGIVLQGMFLPGEPTSAIYQYVASVLNDADAAFELSLPIASKCQVVPSSSFDSSEKVDVTLETADLVPTALLKFRPLGLSGFTGLRQEYVAFCEPLTSIPFPMKG